MLHNNANRNIPNRNSPLRLSLFLLLYSRIIQPNRYFLIKETVSEAAYMCRNISFFEKYIGAHIKSEFKNYMKM